MSRTYTSNSHNPILTPPIRIIFVTTTMRSTLISACLIGASFSHHVFLKAIFSWTLLNLSRHLVSFFFLKAFVSGWASASCSVSSPEPKAKASDDKNYMVRSASFLIQKHQFKKYKMIHSLFSPPYVYF